MRPLQPRDNKLGDDKTANISVFITTWFPFLCWFPFRRFAVIVPKKHGLQPRGRSIAWFPFLRWFRIFVSLCWFQEKPRTRRQSALRNTFRIDVRFLSLLGQRLEKKISFTFLPWPTRTTTEKKNSLPSCDQK